MKFGLLVISIFIHAGSLFSQVFGDSILIESIPFKCGIPAEFIDETPRIISTEQEYHLFISEKSRYFGCMKGRGEVPLIDFEKEAYVCLGTYAPGCGYSEEADFFCLRVDEKEITINVDLYVNRICRGPDAPHYFIVKINEPNISSVNVNWKVLDLYLKRQSEEPDEQSKSKDSQKQ